MQRILYYQHLFLINHLQKIHYLYFQKCLLLQNEKLDSLDKFYDTSNMTIQEYGEYFIKIIKLAIEKLNDIFINVKLWIKGLKTDKVETKELCIDDICINKRTMGATSSKFKCK